MTDWFAPKDIRFTRPQMEWLLVNYKLLKSALWPPQHIDTGYEGKSSDKRGHQAPFEPALRMVVELDARLALLNRTQFMVISEVCIEGGDEYDVADRLNMTPSMVFGCKEHGLKRMSGWRRKGS